METLQLHRSSKFFLNKNKELVKIIVLEEVACLAVLEISTLLGKGWLFRDFNNSTLESISTFRSIYNKLDCVGLEWKTLQLHKTSEFFR